ncbi:MAG: hypothetical protein M3066_06580 [Actinomycetota bacterium]|nr:hypothetical protein [Actinomycetota bacterium]
MSGVLELAAFCSLGAAIGLLLVKMCWPRLRPRVEVRRFRRRLGKAEQVLASWVDECRTRDELGKHEQRHPEPTED